MNRIFYVGSLRHQDCDVFVTVVGYSRKKVDTTLYALADEEYESMKDQWQDDVEDDVENDIIASGTSEENDNIEAFLTEDTEMHLAELEECGITVFYKRVTPAE